MTEIYESLEKMLFQGFLTLPLELSEVPVVFKTVNTKENELVELYASFGSEYDQEIYKTAYFLAYSTFLFNRVNVFSDRDSYLSMLVSVYINLPQEVIKDILFRLHKLNTKATQTLKKVEAYSYGYLSRQNWHSYQKTLLNDPKITAIQGTETLGLNAHQKLWVFYNTREDLDLDFDRQRSLAKFQASVHAPKGIKKLDAKDREERREQQRHREALHAGGGVDDIHSYGPGEIKISDESVEDLMGQMKRSIAGQKDFHDHVVEAHEQRMRDRYEEEKRRRDQEINQAGAKKKDKLEGVDPEIPFLFYDEGEVQEEVETGRKRKSHLLKSGYYQDEAAFQQRQEHLSKWHIIESENPPQPPSEPNLSSEFEGTILDEYHQVIEEDTDTPIDPDSSKKK